MVPGFRWRIAAPRIRLAAKLAIVWLMNTIAAWAQSPNRAKMDPLPPLPSAARTPATAPVGGAPLPTPFPDTARVRNDSAPAPAIPLPAPPQPTLLSGQPIQPIDLANVLRARGSA